MPTDLDVPALTRAPGPVRPGPTVGEALAETLGVAVNAGFKIASIAQQREIDEIDQLLSNPALTPEEAQELGDAASFPLARTRARNRQGELLAEQAYDDLADAVAEAPDAPEARRRIRAIQQSVISRTNDGEVVAGIHERFASYAPQLLADASRRRVERRVEAEDVTMSADLTSAFGSRGARGFSMALEGQLIDEELTGGDPDRVHTIALTTLENEFLSGYDPANPTQNFNAREVLSTIDGLLDSPMTARAAVRNKYLDLRTTILTSEERNRRAEGTLSTEAQKAEHAQWTALAAQLRRAGQPIPDFLAQKMIDSAVTAAQVQSAERFANNLEEGGMPDTAEARAGRSQLNERLGFNPMTGEYTAATFGADAKAYFERSLRSLPIIEEADERIRVINELVREAEKVGEATESRRLKDEQAFQAQQQAIQDLLDTAIDAGDVEEAERLEAQLADGSWVEFEKQRFNARMQTFLTRQGYGPKPTVINTQR